MVEFNLSEKIEKPIEFSIGQDYDARSVKLGIQKERARIREDIKEFIKRLKGVYGKWINTEELDKLAGEKLI